MLVEILDSISGHMGCDHIDRRVISLIYDGWVTIVRPIRIVAPTSFLGGDQVYVGRMSSKLVRR